MAINWQSLLGVERVRDCARYWLEESSVAVEDRLELIQIEARRQLVAVIGIVVIAALMLFLFFGVLMVGSVIALLHWWQTPQWGAAMVWVGCAWLVVLLVSALVLMGMVKRAAKPFALTRQVMAQDWRDLKERL